MHQTHHRLFPTTPCATSRRRRTLRPSCAKKDLLREQNGARPEPGLGLKAVWHGAEQLGNLIGLGKGPRKQNGASAVVEKQVSRKEVLASIRRDYDEQYFVSGRGEMWAYQPDCYFADPFAGFTGTARFKNNVSNLGGLLEDVKLDLLDWRESEDELWTRWKFSGVLALPWRPRLAAGGSTRHVFCKDTGRVVKHLEQWDSEPGKVVRSLLRPAAQTPGNRWEAAFQAIDRGQPGAFWSATALFWTAASTPVVVVSLSVKLATGQGLQGVFLGAVEGIAYLLLLAGAGTEAWKAVKGSQD